MIDSERLARFAGVDRLSAHKLSESEVLEIRRLLSETALTQAEVGSRFGVSKQTISNIARRRTWPNVGDKALDRPTMRPQTNTGFWGVTANGAGNRFLAWITENGPRRELGSFRDPIEAARRYDKRARELGFAAERLNFPDAEDY